MGGMGRFGMIYPHGLAPFLMGIWTSLFRVGDMDCPVFGWGYGAALFPDLLSPNLPSLMRLRATRCIYVYCEIGMLSWVHDDAFTLCREASIFAPCALRPLLLFVMELSIGDKVFYIRSTGLRRPTKVIVIAFLGPRLHWVMVNLGTECGKVIIKVVHMARTGQTLTLSACPMHLAPRLCA